MKVAFGLVALQTVYLSLQKAVVVYQDDGHLELD